jgi:hypothetical protein
MLKSAKRGEPQIFLLCVTLWASAGSVVSARAFAVPVPHGIGRKQKRATLASAHWKGCWGLPFSTRESAIRGTRPQKNHFAGAILPWSDRASPFFLSGRVGTKVKNAHHEYFTPVRQPNDCCPRKRHVWGTRQSRWFRGPAALLCELSLFVLAVTSRKTDPRSNACASDLKGRRSSPIRPKGANFGLDLQGCRGLLF